MNRRVIFVSMAGALGLFLSATASAAVGISGGLSINKSQAKHITTATFSTASPNSSNSAVTTSRIFEEGDLRHDPSDNCSSSPCVVNAIDNSVSFGCEYCGDGNANFYLNGGWVAYRAAPQTCDNAPF